MESNKKWYQNSIVIAALIILFFPVGLFLMWKYTNWNIWIKGVITGFFVILIIGGIASDGSKTKEVKTIPSPTPTITIQSTFNVPSLVGKNIDEVREILGQPIDKNPELSTEQKKLGAKEWSNTFTKDGNELLVTFNSDSRKVTDFFISADDASGQTQDTARLLIMGNLKENDPAYQIEFIKVITDPSYYTGVKVIPN